MDWPYVPTSHCSIVGVVVNYALSEITMNTNQNKSWRRVAKISKALLNCGDDIILLPDADIASSVMLVADSNDVHFLQTDFGSTESLFEGLEKCPIVCKLLKVDSHLQ